MSLLRIILNKPLRKQIKFFISQLLKKQKKSDIVEGIRLFCDCCKCVKNSHLPQSKRLYVNFEHNLTSRETMVNIWDWRTEEVNDLYLYLNIESITEIRDYLTDVINYNLKNKKDVEQTEG